MPRNDAVESMMLAFRTPSGATFPAASVSVTRDRMRPNETLRTHTDRALSRLGRETDELDLLESRAIEIAGHRAQRLRFTWLGPFGRMDQTTVLVDPGNDPERRVVILTVVGPAELAEETARVFEQLLTTVRFEDASTERMTDLRPPPRPEEQPVIPMPGYWNTR
jgi:hypothetical protein